MKKLLGSLALLVLGAGAFIAATLIPPMVAHAATTDTAPAVLGLSASWLAYLGLGLAALGGIRTIVDVLLAGLKWLAPRTKTPLDDTARDDLQFAHNKLDLLIDLLRGLMPNSKSQADASKGGAQ